VEQETKKLIKCQHVAVVAYTVRILHMWSVSLQDVIAQY